MKTRFCRGMKTICCAVTAAALLAGCGGTGGANGGGQGTQTPLAQDTKDAVYSGQEIRPEGLPFRLDNVELLRGEGDRVYAAASKYVEENEGTDYFVASFLPDGSDVKAVKIDHLKDGYFSNMAFDKEGNFYAVKCTYPESMNGEDPSLYTEEADEGRGPGPDASADAEDTAADTEASEQADETQEDEAAEDASPEDGAEAADEKRVTGEMEMPDEELREQYALLKYDAAGTKVFEQRLGENAGKDIWYGVNSMYYVEGRGLLLSDALGLGWYDAETGAAGKTIREDASEIDTINVTADGRAYAMIYGENGVQFRSLDLETGETGEDVTMPEGYQRFGFYNLVPGKTADFLLQSEAGIFGWTIGEPNLVQICNYLASDLPIVDSSARVAALEDGRFVVMYYDELRVEETRSLPESQQESASMQLLTKVAPEDVKERVNLSLGVVWADTPLRSAVVKYNKSQNDYRINVTDYGDFWTEEDYNAPLTKLNSDIISGNTPDLLMVRDAQMPIESYIAKGVFEPLDEYFANDAEISGKEYLENIFDVYRYQGKMYRIVPSFRAMTFAAKPETVQGVSKWNLQALNALAKERNVKPISLFGYPQDRASVLRTMVVLNSSYYIDWNNQKANFETETFRDLLEFAKEFPAEVTEQMYEETDGDYYEKFRTGESLINMASFGDYQEYREMKYVVFGGDMEMIGYPRENGEKGSSAIVPNMSVAMSASSDHKDACWAFLRSFLLDEAQESSNLYGLPVSVSALEKLAEKSMKQNTIIDEEGNEVEDPMIYYFGEEEYVVPPLTKEDTDAFMTFLRGLDLSYTFDESVLNIIDEESAPFFAGQKSAEDVMKIIQSKIQTYIYENS